MSAAIRRILGDPAVRVALAAFVTLRLITAIAAVWAYSLGVPENPWQNDPIFKEGYSVGFTTPAPLRTLLEPWYRWDTGWYVHIAYYGYAADDGSIIFGPLYPLTMRLLAPFVGGDYLLAGIVISNVCCFLMLILLYKLIRHDSSDAVATRTIWLYMVFPSAFFFFAAYTESLFMALLLGAWLAVQRQRYVLGGVLALLASLTRSQAWTLALPFTIIAFIEHAPAGSLIEIVRYHLAQPVETLRRGFAVVGGVIGTAAYFLGMQISGLGDVSAAFVSPWHVQVSLPWETLRQALQGLFNGSLKSYDYASLSCFAFVLIMTLLTIRRLRAGYWLYVLASLSYMLLRRHDEYQLHGMVRYTMHLFPAFIALSLLLGSSVQAQRGRVRLIIEISYVVFGIALQIGFVMLFSRWYLVS